ncbi:MAG: pentapeptide repeat-containing protein [Planctomycetota bacterium]|jgi:hypothetical protein|nr:pentapeptide repeat-containing protein [Planctomycetota bacterium]
MLVQGHDDPMATDNPSRRPYGAWARRLALGSLAVLGLWFALDLLPGQRARTFAVWRAAELERGVSVARVPEQVAHETRVLGFLACLAVLAAGAVRAGQRHSMAARASAEPHAIHEQARALARDVTREALETARALAPPPAPTRSEPTGPAEPATLACEPLTQVVERLRDPWAPVRLGAIHSLRRIGETYADWRAATVDVLAAYVREHAALPETAVQPERRSLLGGGSLKQGAAGGGGARTEEEPTLQQALTALGALARPEVDGALDLGGLQLSGLNLEGARLEGASFRGTHVAGLSLAGARLQGADLSAAVGLDLEQLRGARVDETTRLPQSVARGG